VDGARGRRPVEQPDELAVVARRRLAVAVLHGLLEPLEERLGARAVAEVLHPLSRGGLDASLLLLDVRHAANDASSEEASGRLPMLAP
jgi:hypothetical protein